MKKLFFIVLLNTLSASVYCRPPTIEEVTKKMILAVKSEFAQLLHVTESIIAEDELAHCHGFYTSNSQANLVGSCYLNDNGARYLLVVTEDFGARYEIIYPVYQFIKINPEL